MIDFGAEWSERWACAANLARRLALWLWDQAKFMWTHKGWWHGENKPN